MILGFSAYIRVESSLLAINLSVDLHLKSVITDIFPQKQNKKKSYTKKIEKTADFVERVGFVPFFPLWAGLTQVSIL